MREIKFRAWFDEYSIGEWEMVYFSLENIIHMIDPGDDGIKWSDGDAVMQYTGLKDKNGKEIYEGDVVAPGDGRFKEVNGKQHDFSYVVKFEMFSAGDMGMDSYGFHFNPYWKSIEVIGNIYENPELLDD